MFSTPTIIRRTIVWWLVASASCFSSLSFSRTHQQPETDSKRIAFFDVLDLPARIDEPKLQRPGDYVLNCAVANRSGEQLVGLRLTLMFVDSANGRVTRTTWNEVADVPAYSIKTLEFHPPIKNELKSADIFLGIDEVIGRETVWRTVDADKLLRAYARGQHGLIPKVQKLQNKFDRESPRVISRTEPKPKP